MQFLPPLPASWAPLLENKAMAKLLQEVDKALAIKKDKGAVIYPPQTDIFKALQKTPLDDVKVVILGQDPYHGAGQAHGLAFSVPEHVTLPPSLKNIFKELGYADAKNGDLTHWAEQGVLLLNTTLTVEKATPLAHKGLGWEGITDHIIEYINQRRKGVVFMLWGSHSLQKINLIDAEKHCILQAPHPSPLSAYRGFFGCGHFQKANAYLDIHNKQPINWQPKEANELALPLF